MKCKYNIMNDAVPVSYIKYAYNYTYNRIFEYIYMCKRFTWNRNILKQANDFVIKMRLKHISIKTLKFVCEIIQIRLITTDW